MNYKKQMAKGTFLVFLSVFIAAFFGYFLRLLLARSFSVSEYGAIYSVIALFGLFGIFVNLGLRASLVKYIPEFRLKKQFSRLKNSIIIVAVFQFAIALILGILFIVFSEFFAKYYLHNENFKFLIILFALFFILNPLLELLKTIFISFQKLEYYSIVESIQPVIVFLLTALFIYFGFGIISVFLSYVLFVFFAIIIFYLIFKYKVFPRFSKINYYFDKNLMKSLMKFGYPLLLVGVFGVVYGKIDTIFLSIFTSLEEVGLYNVAYPTVSTIWRITSVFVLSLTPIISRLTVKREINKIRKGIIKLYSYTLIVILPVTLVVFLFPKVIITILFGEKFIEAVSILRILSFAILLQVFIKINNSVLIGYGLPSKLAKYFMYGGLINIFGNFILIPIFGGNGAAVSTLLSFLVIFVFSSIMLTSSIKLNFPWKEYFKIICCSLIFVFMLIIFKEILQISTIFKIFISIFISTLVYALLIFKLKIVNFNELKSFF